MLDFFFFQIFRIIRLENKINLIVKNTNYLVLGFSANITILGNDYKISEDNFIKYYQCLYPTISARRDDKLIITGNYNGLLKIIYDDNNNLYKKLNNNI